ncbi:hypothetical protein BC828DRAFT_210071 [Blastocladiella britannica]|nr:hypothetical protein BC828DRAFT_210071 [Blastocladiella britannica]
MMAPAIPANNNDDLDPYLLALITLHLPGARAPLASEFPPSQRVALRYLGSRPGAALVSWPAAGPTARDPVRTTWVTPDGALDARCGALDRDLTTLGASPLLERQTRRDLAPSSPPVPAATLRRPQFSRRLPPRTGHGLDRLAAAALDLPPSRAGLVITTLTDGDEPLDANLPMAAQLLHLYLPAAPSCGHVARRIEPYAANLARRNVRRFFIAMDGTREAIADSIMIGEAVLPAVDRILDLASEMERQGIFELDLDDDGHDADDGMDPINGILDSDQAQPIGGGGLRALVPLRFSGVRNHAIAAAANTDDNDSADDDADDAMDVDDNTDHHGGAPPDLSDVVARLHTRIEGIAARAMLDNPDLVADGHAGMLDIQTLSNTESFNAPPSRLGSPVPPLQTTELASATDAIAALPTPVPPLPGSMPEPAVVEDPFAVPFTPRDALERLKQHVDARRLALVEQYRWTCAAPSSASGRMRLEHRIRAIAQTDLPRLMDKVIERCATWKDLEQYQAALDPLLDEWARGIARLEGPMRPVGDSESSDASDAIDSVDEWSDVGDNDDGDGEDTSTTKNSDGNDKDEEDDHDDDTKSVLSDSNFIVPDDVGGSQTADPYMSPSLVVEADSRQRQLIRTLRVLLEQPAESAKAQVALLADVDKTMAALAAAPSGSLPPTNLQAYLALHAAHQMSIQRLTERASSKSRKQVRHALRVDPLTTFRLLRKEAWTETVEAMWAAIESFDSAEAALKQEKAAVKAAKATAGSGGGGGSAAATGAGSSSGNSIGSGAPRPMQTSPGNKAIQGAVSSPKVNLPSTEPILISDSESSSDDESRDPAFVLDGSTSPPIRIPALLAGILKPHQLEGVRFLWQRIHKDGGGAILAHQMGVGKTLQVIAFLYCTFRAMQVFPHKFSSQMRTRRVIVLCPKSVVTNWIDEVHKWIPAKQQAKSDFHVYKFDHANLTARHDCVRKWHETGGILVASYGMFCVTLQTRTTAKRAPTAEEERLCAEMKAMTISSASIVVFDEAHTIKNPDTILATVIKSGLHENAARIALTGTPLQNNLGVLYPVRYRCSGLPRQPQRV